MKTYEEKTQHVFQKMEEAKTIQKKRMGTVKRVMAPILSLCLVAVIGFVAWQTGLFHKMPIISDSVPGNETAANPAKADAVSSIPDSKAETESRQTLPQPSADHSGEQDGVCVSADSSLGEWENKTVHEDLANALDEAPSDKVFNILARPYIDYEFVFEGHTLAEYYSVMCDERNLPDVLAQLLKEGDSLKYGPALCESGTPDGEKWAPSLYEERIAFYGAAVLDKYIVNGEFLRDQVENDLEAINSAEKEASEAYNAAFAAYYQHLADTIPCSVPAEAMGTDGIVMQMTAEEFRNFTAEHLEAWIFRLWSAEPYVSDATDDPVQSS